MVLDTGRLEPLTQGLQRQLLLIQSENEKLSAGEEALAYWTDNHALHIKEHATVLASLEARMNQEVFAATNAHIQEHAALLMETDPQLLQLTGQQPMQSATQPPAPGQGASSTMQDPNAQAASDVPPATKMPKNPMTGDQFSPTEPPINGNEE